KNDLIIVEGGSYRGTLLGVAEKHLLWIKITTRGKQVHASTPSKGLNATKIGMEVALALSQDLHRKYNKRDSFFIPEFGSTFEITKKDANVSNINTIPGVDVFYMDCRVLPEYSMNEVL